MKDRVSVRVENRSEVKFSVSPAELETIVKASGLREALEPVQVLATFHDWDEERSSRRGTVSLMLDVENAARIRVKVFVRDGDLEEANATFAHELRHAAQYAWWGAWTSMMDGDELEQDAYEFECAQSRMVVK